MESSALDTLTPRQRNGLRMARRAATRLLKRRARLYFLAKRGFMKLKNNPKALRKVQDDLLTLVRLARAWAKREYRSVPWRSLLYATAALLYFVNPADILPDALLGIGFVDDVAIVSAVVKMIQDDLQDFASWEERQLEA